MFDPVEGCFQAPAIVNTPGRSFDGLDGCGVDVSSRPLVGSSITNHRPASSRSLVIGSTGSRTVNVLPCPRPALSATMVPS